jgi:hypothetical protein
MERKRMNRCRLFLICVVSLLTFQVPLLFSTEKTPGAFLDFKTENVKRASVRAVSDLFEMALVNTGRFLVVERGTGLCFVEV